MGDLQGLSKFFIIEFVQKVCDKNIIPLKEIISGYERNLMNSMNTKIEKSKEKFGLEQVNNMKKIQDMYEKKVDELTWKIRKVNK